MKKMHKAILRRLLLALLAALLGYSIYSWNAGIVMGNDLPMPFGYGVSVVLSGSMEPALGVDDLVVIKESDEIAVNDIVVFRDGGHLTIHRVVAIDGETLQTKGDANNVADPPILQEQVEGVLLWHIPGLGTAVRFLKKPAVAALLLALIFVLTELSYRKEKEKHRDELDEIRLEIKNLLSEMDKTEEKEE